MIQGFNMGIVKDELPLKGIRHWHIGERKRKWKLQDCAVFKVDGLGGYRVFLNGGPRYVRRDYTWRVRGT